LCNTQNNLTHNNHHQLPYVISIEYETKKGALLAPQLNIPARGLIPTTIETFTVHLPCSGNVSEEVPIAINLKVRNPFGVGHNETILHFKRNKICMRGKCFSFEILILIISNCTCNGKYVFGINYKNINFITFLTK
jgi:hypothetical protein